MALEKVGTFVLTDESLDSDSERVMIDGVDLSRFEGNPVMLYNHIRSASGWFSNTPDTRAILPIGRWENIRKQRKRIVADAYIDFDDEFAAKVGNKVRNGVLNAVSIGFRPLAWSDDPDDMVKGQTGLTITKAELWEASLVDVPANPNALVMSVTKSVKQGDNKEQQTNPNGIYIKTFHKINDNTMAENKNLFEKAKAFLAKLGKTVETEEDAVKAFEETELPTPEFDAEHVKTLATDVVNTQVKSAVDAVREEMTAQINALDAKIKNLADQNNALVELLAETEQKSEEKEDETEKSIKALELQLANLKAARTANKPGVDTPPANTQNTAEGEENDDEKFVMIDGVKVVRPKNAKSLVEVFQNTRRNQN